MTTNETSFFRDMHPFEALRHHVIPELVSQRAKERTLRIWCAACSSGQEPYSMAILLRQYFPELGGWDIQILATDISRQMLQRAQAGKYRQVEVNRGLTAALMAKYFSRHGLEFEIDPSLRAMVRFAELNLIQSWPRLPMFDIVFLRNVLIYFDQDVKRALLHKIKRQLSPDAYLLLGGSETLPAEDASFERLNLPRSGCYRMVKSSS